MPTPARRCLTCGYPVDHLLENRCPECGREFDPNDPGTYATGDIRFASGSGYLIAVCVGALLIAAPFLYVAAGGERSSGFWMVPSGGFLLCLMALPVGILIEVVVLVAMVRARLRGRRSRSGDVVMWFALGCVIMGVLLPATVVTRVKPSDSNAPWRQPFATIMEQVASGDTRAVRELRRRAREGELSSMQAQLVAETALSQHKNDLPWRELLPWAGILIALERTLTDAQRAQAQGQLVPLELMVPKQVRQGRPLAVEIAYALRGIKGGVSPPTLKVRGVRLDGNPRQDLERTPRTHVLYGGSWSRVTGTLDVADLEPGQHTVEYELQIICIGNRNLVLSADFDIVPREAPDPTGLLDTPAFARILQDRLLVRFLRRRGWLLLSLMEPVPTDLTFDVVVDVEGEEFPVGTVTWAKGGMRAGAHFEIELPRFEGDQIDVILRGFSAERGDSTPDDEIWDGEVRFDGINTSGKRNAHYLEIIERMKRAKTRPGGR